jgi:hypothetical protein
MTKTWKDAEVIARLEDTIEEADRLIRQIRREKVDRALAEERVKRAKEIADIDRRREREIRKSLDAIESAMAGFKATLKGKLTEEQLSELAREEARIRSIVEREKNDKRK